MAFATGSNPQDLFRRVSTLSSKQSKKKKKAGVSRLQTTYLVVLLVLPSSFPQSFVYHLAGRHVPVRADGIKLQGSGETTTAAAYWESKEACKWFAGQYGYQPSQELRAYNR